MKSPYSPFIGKDTKLRELGASLDISGIKEEYLDKTFGELGEMTWAEVDPTGRIVESFNIQAQMIESSIKI